MITYLDTSALVPLLIKEPSSAACTEAWEKADVVLATRLVYVEATAALGQAERMGRISARALAETRAHLDDVWSSIDVMGIDEALMREAANVAVDLRLRGDDAMHCAAAILANDGSLVAASGDKRLLAALQASGVATLDTGP